MPLFRNFLRKKPVVHSPSAAATPRSSAHPEVHTHHTNPPVIPAEPTTRPKSGRKVNLQAVHATKAHPGAKKSRNRLRNKQARASRKANR